MGNYLAMESNFVPSEEFDPVKVRHRDLERIANAALRVGRTLMECGASVSVIQEGATLVARGLGAESIGIRVGYASLAFTVASNETTITRMVSVGRHGVNHRLDIAVRGLATKVAATGGTVRAVNAELDRLIRETPKYPHWFVALATGAACAGFGRLLGADWMAFLPVLAAGAIGQALRHLLLTRCLNIFVMAAMVAFVAGSFGGWGARLLGSASVDTAMIAATLLLVPGVPATNAQTDIMEGYPTVGSARAVWVGMAMVFASTGIWCAQALLRGFP
jgi:uncharacterized membrane protein YjjP (DUF1212 family)